MLSPHYHKVESCRGNAALASHLSSKSNLNVAAALRFAVVTAAIILTVFRSAAMEWSGEESRLRKKCLELLEARQNYTMIPVAEKLERIANASGNRDAADLGLSLRLSGEITTFSNNPLDSLHAIVLQRISKRAGEKASESLVNLYLANAVYHYSYEVDFPEAIDSGMKALELARELGDRILEIRALSILAAIYRDRGDSEGMKWAKQCEEISRNINDRAGLYVTATNMASYYYMKGDMDSAVRYLDRADSIARSAGMDQERFYLESFRAEIFRHRSQFESADSCYRLALNTTENNSPFDRWYAKVSYAYFLIDRHRYEEALALINDAEKDASQFRRVASYPYMVYQKSVALEALGRTAEALAAYKQYDLLKSEAVNADTEKAIKALEIKYEVAEKDNLNNLQKLEIMKKKRSLTITVSIIAVLLVLLIAAVFLHHRTRRYYKRIVSDKIEAQKREKQLREQLAEIVKSGHKESVVKERKISERSDDIFLRLNLLMEEEKVYRRYDLTLEQLASLVGTNRTYLLQAIKQKTGLTYSSYVNEFRINDAVEQLTTSTAGDIVKTVAATAGFDSTSNFYRLFKKKVGVSPLVFRQQAISGNIDSADSSESESLPE